MIKKFIVLILSAVVWGCATVSTVTPTSDIPPENGLVIFKLSANSPNIGFFRYWRGVTVKSINQERSKEYTIGFSAKGNSRSAVYFGSLPEGEYELVEFSSGQCGAMCISSHVSLSKAMGSFSIKSSEITDLGHLLYVAVGRDKSLVVHGKSQDQWVGNYLNEFYPHITQTFSTENMAGWENAHEHMADMYKGIKNKSKGLLRPFETSNGSVLFGSYLGNVRVWYPEKGVRSYDTGVQEAIESVAELEDGTWIAGSESGRIVMSKDFGVSWRDFGSPFLNSSIMGLTPYDKKIFATVATHEKIGIYYREFSSDKWELVSEHPLKFAFWTGVQIYPSSIAYENKLVTSLPSKALAITDMDSLTTMEKSFPGGISAFTLGNDGVIRCSAAKTLAVNPYESHDWGETWVSSKHSRFMTLPYFKDDAQGFGLQGAWLSGKANLSVSSDGGETWAEKVPLPYRTPYFSHLKQSGELFAWDGYNTIVLGKNNGEKWIVQ